MKRTIPALCVVLSCAALAPYAWSSTQASQASAATQAPPAAAPQRQQQQQSPEMKALNEAVAVKDLDEKIAAIRKVIADFPKGSVNGQANTQLLDALVKKRDLAAIGAQAKVIVAGADEGSRSRLQRDVASALLRGDVLLEDAETYAKGAIESLPDEKAYVEARKKEAAARAASRAAEGGSAPGATPAVVAAASSAPATPGDEMFVARYKSEKQTALSTLGQVYAKRGKPAEAEKALREAYLLDRKSAAATTAALKLAEYSKAAGRDAEQFDYLAGVALAGRLTPDAHADFQAVYRKLHDGSLDGMEDALDARYEKEGPKAPEVTRYTPTPERSTRLVLAEVFTGAGCPPCVAADLAFESAMRRYGPGELAVLMYHLHVPRPDPMTNPYTQARSKFYSVPGVPTFALDGESKTGGGAADNALPFFRKSVEPVVDKRLTVKAEASLSLKASSTDKAVTATVTVGPIETKAAKLRLHLVLAEEQIRYSGENGIRFHPMVVRSMAADGVEAPKPPAAPAEPNAKPAAPGLPVPVLGFAIEPGKAKTLEYTFDLAKVTADGLANLEDLEQNSTRYPNHKFVQKKHEIDPKRLLLVAFVQDEESKQVLQAVRMELK